MVELLKQRLEEQMLKYGAEDVCLAFSGGVDSSLLLKTARLASESTGKQVYAVTFDSRLHPSCDLENAKKVAGELGGIHKVLSVDELEQEEIRNNPQNRCYLCKRHLFQRLVQFAEENRARYILDGTNEDDMHVYRPGIRALQELGIHSPLAELHMTKSDVKALAAFYGISAAQRPSTPCMATRLPYNTEIRYEVLERISRGEEFLRDQIGGNVRLRLHGDIARIELDQDRIQKAAELKGQITAYLKKLGFCYITLDLEGFRSGSMDIPSASMLLEKSGEEGPS